jgi:tetratricopeptide (TPR) repeat protein
MLDPVTTSILAGVVSGLAKDAVVWGWDKAKETGFAHDIRDAIGRDQLFPTAEKVFKRAIRDASRDLPHLDSETLEGFFETSANRHIVSQWLWEPSRADVHRAQLDFSQLVSGQERSNVEHFLERLPEAIEHNAREVFDDDAWLVIRRLSTALRHEGEKRDAHITVEHEKTRDHLDAKFEDLKDYTESLLEASGGQNGARKIEASIQADLDEVRRRIDTHRIEQAIDLANRTLRKIEDQDLGPDARRTAHEHLANAYLATLDQRKAAIPHVDALAALATDDLARLRNLAMAAHLRGDVERGLQLVDEALDQDPTDRTSLLVKGNLLAASGREAEAVDLCAEHVDEKNTADLHNLGQMEIRAGRHEDALSHAEMGLMLEPDNPDLCLLFGMAAVHARNQRIEMGGTGLDAAEHETLQDARSHLSVATDAYVNNPSRQGASYFYRGVIALWLGSPEDAERAFERAHELAPDDSPTLHNLTLLALARSDAVQARNYIEQLNATNHDIDRAEMLFMESRILRLEGDAQEAVRILEDARDQPSGDEAIDLQILLARAYRDNFEIEKAEEIMSTLRRDHPTDPRLLVEEMRLAQNENLGEAIAKCREALSHITDRRAARLKAALADLLFNRAEQTGSESDYEEALTLYRERLAEHPYEQTLWREAVCLFRLGRYEECMHHCEQAHADKPRPELMRIQGRIHELHENYLTAAEAYKKVALQSGADVDALLRCSQCYALIGEASKARGAARKVANRIEESASRNQLILSHAFRVSGDMKRAVHHMYLAQKHGGDERRYAEAYLGLFITHSKDIEAQGAADAEHYEAYQHLLIEYPEQHPDSKFLQRFKVPDNPDEMIAQLRDQLPSPKEIEEREEVLKTKKLPVGAVAKLLGCSVAKAWALLAGQRDYELAADDGPVDVLHHESDIAGAADAIMLDSVPLFTLDELGLLDRLPAAFEEIYVTQAAFDELHTTIESERPTEGEDRRFVRADGESPQGISFDKIPAEQHDAFLSRLRRVRTFIQQTDNVYLVGRSLGRPDRPEDIQVAGDSDTDEPIDLYYDDILGRPAAETLREAPLRGLTVYVEDALLRRFARAEGSEAFGTKALLEALAEEEIISAPIYHTARIRLIEMGYGFPSISLHTLMYAIELDGVPTPYSQIALSALEDPRNDLQSLFFLGAKLIFWLWHTHRGAIYIELGQSLTVTWTWRILSVVAGAEERRRMATAIRAAFVETSEPLVQELGRHKFDAMVQSISHWESNHSVQDED